MRTTETAEGEGTTEDTEKEKGKRQKEKGREWEPVSAGIQPAGDWFASGSERVERRHSCLRKAGWVFRKHSAGRRRTVNEKRLLRIPERLQKLGDKDLSADLNNICVADKEPHVGFYFVFEDAAGWEVEELSNRLMIRAPLRSSAISAWKREEVFSCFTSCSIFSFTSSYVGVTSA